MGTRGDIKGPSIGNTSMFSFPLLNFMTKISDNSPPRTPGLDRKQNLMVYSETGSVQINSARDCYFFILPTFHLHAMKYYIACLQSKSLEAKLTP